MTIGDKVDSKIRLGLQPMRALFRATPTPTLLGHTPVQDRHHPYLMVGSGRPPLPLQVSLTF